MEISPKTFIYIAYFLTGMLGVAGIDKKLRNDRIIIIVGIITLLIGLIGLAIRSESTQMPRGNATDTLFGPFIFIASYGLLRKIYKSIYKVEPTYTWLTAYDWEDNRKVNVLDKIVHVLPLLLGILLPFLGILLE